MTELKQNKKNEQIMFLSMNLDDKINNIKKRKLCLDCFSHNHFVWKCRKTNAKSVKEHIIFYCTLNLKCIFKKFLAYQKIGIEVLSIVRGIRSQ